MNISAHPLSRDEAVSPPAKRTAYYLDFSYRLRGLDLVEQRLWLGAISDIEEQAVSKPADRCWLPVELHPTRQSLETALPEDVRAYGLARLREPAGQVAAFLTRVVGAAALGTSPQGLDSEHLRASGWIFLELEIGGGDPPALRCADLGLEVVDSQGKMCQAFLVQVPASFPRNWTALSCETPNPAFRQLAIRFGPAARIAMSRLAWWAVRGDPDLNPALIDPGQ